MKQKKVLIIYPSALIPAIMMSQKRTLEQIFTLQKDHQVGVLCICRNTEEAAASKAFFSKKNIQFHTALSSRKNKLINIFFTLWYIIKNYLFAHKIEYHKNSSSKVKNKILDVINNHYDIVISHFWYGSAFMKDLDDTISMIDTHGLVEESIELNRNSYYITNRPKHEFRVFTKNLKLQQDIHKHSNYLILNSNKSYELAKLNYPECNSIYCPNGQDLNYYFSFAKVDYDPNTILFYGSYGGAQNKIALELFYKEIWPKIIDSKPNSKLLVLGNKPPQWIRDLSKDNNIEVTGFVDDIRPYMQRAACMLIPMTVGVGFRGRIIEVMAMGVPIVGNHNALDCIGLENEVNGFISDDYQLMANYAIKLLDSSDYRNSISKRTEEFVLKNYSIEATFGKLSHLIEGL